MSFFEEFTKDWANDEEAMLWMRNIADELPKRSLEGIFCATSPKSESSWIGAHCDFITGQFLLKSIIEEFAEKGGVSPTRIALTLAWYFAQTETGVLIESTNQFNAARKHEAKKFLKETLNFVISKTKGINPCA